MGKRSMAMLIAVVVLMGMNACQLLKSPLERELEKSNVPAVIAITPEGDFAVYGPDGSPLESCSIPNVREQKKGAHIPEDTCPAFKEGAEKLFEKTIVIIKSKGSCWFTYYDSAHNAHKVRLPDKYCQ